MAQGARGGVYHGWKFDVEGICLDMLNEPPGSDYKDKVRTNAYPTYEAGGVVWAYLGPAGKRPAPPLFEWTEVPESHRLISKNIQECNWLQGLEGGIDTAPCSHPAPHHFSYNHAAWNSVELEPG